MGYDLDITPNSQDQQTEKCMVLVRRINFQILGVKGLMGHSSCSSALAGVTVMCSRVRYITCTLTPRSPATRSPAFVQRVDNSIHWINQDLLDSVVCSANT